MTIYIVTSGEYSDYRIRAAFTDRKKAELYCAMHESGYYYPEIEEWETEDGNIESVATVNKYFHASFSTNGDLICDLENRYNLQECGPVQVSMERNPYSRFRYALNVNVVLPIDTPSDKAEKIMRDAVAKWRYEHLVEGKANDA